MVRSILLGAAVTLAGAACSSNPTPSESLLVNTVSACRTLAYDEGLEVVEMGEATGVPGGAEVEMRVRGDGATETRTCMFREQYDSARFVESSSG